MICKVVEASYSVDVAIEETTTDPDDVGGDTITP